jgi:hypothetical protein
MANVNYLSYQAPIKGYDSSGVPLVDIPAASRIDNAGLQSVYSNAYVASGGSTYSAERAVENHLTELGASHVSFTSVPQKSIW